MENPDTPDVHGCWSQEAQLTDSREAGSSHRGGKLTTRPYQHSASDLKETPILFTLSCRNYKETQMHKQLYQSQEPRLIVILTYHLNKVFTPEIYQFSPTG